MTIVPIVSHIGRTYSADAHETLKALPAPEWSYCWSPLPVIGVSPLKYQSWSGPTSSLLSAMKPSTETTLCMMTVPTALPHNAVANVRGLGSVDHTNDLQLDPGR